MISSTFEKTKSEIKSKSLLTLESPTIQIIGPSVYSSENAVAPISVALESLIQNLP